MGTVISRGSGIQAAAIARLDKAIASVCQAKLPDEREIVGKLLYEEATKAYWMCDVPAALRQTPWLFVLSRHAQQCPERKADYEECTRCVTVFLTAKREGRAG